MTALLTAFTLSKAVLAIGIISVLGGCATNAPSKHNPGGANITVSSMQPIRDENIFLKADTSKPINMNDIKTKDRKLSFDEALTFDQEVGFGQVALNFSAINDKAVKGNPAIHKKWYDAKVHTDKTYTGFDDWGGEYAADLLTRLEYHLIRDARRLLGEKDRANAGIFAHHRHSRQIKRLRRPTFADNAKFMNEYMIWLKELGFSDKKITEFTYNCMPITYSKMMYESGNGKEGVKHWYAWGVYREFHVENSRLRREMQYPSTSKEKAYIQHLNYRGNSLNVKFTDKDIADVMGLSIMKRQDQCEPFKDTMLVDGMQLFYKKAPKEIENGVFETVYVDEPRFTPQLFQNLFSKNYFGELPRVSENGAFSSLRKPEGRSFVMEYNVRKSGLPHMQKEKYDVAKYGNNDAIKTAAIAKMWLGETYFIHHYNVLDWSIEFKKYSSSMGNGLLGCRINNNEMNLQINTSKIRRIYNCSIKNSRNKFTNAFVRLLNGPGTEGSLFATVDVEGSDFGGAHFVESKRAEYVNETLFNMAKPMLINEYIEDTVLRRVPVNTAIAYIQKLPDGKVEGVVHVLGYKVIYDLTKISNWYETEMSEAYPVDKPLTKWADIHVKSTIAAEREFKSNTE